MVSGAGRCLGRTPRFQGGVLKSRQAADNSAQGRPEVPSGSLQNKDRGVSWEGKSGKQLFDGGKHNPRGLFAN